MFINESPKLKKTRNYQIFQKIVEKEFEKGTVIGAYHTVFGILVFPASVISGLLWQKYSLEYAFIYATIMNMTALVLMIITDRRTFISS